MASANPQSSDSETLGSVGEGGVLARIFPRLPAAASQIIGPGDDAAVVAAPDGRYVVTTDMMVHGPDFRLAWSSPFDLGWKAAASNLSDVASMGAVPTALVVAIAAPAETSVEFLERFADGLREGCDAMAPGCGVVGGDLSVSPTMTIAVTAFGDLEGRAPVLRSGAHVGDTVAVSGSLGLAGEGLRLLFTHAVIDGVPDAPAAARLAAEHPEPVAAQLRPHPPIADGRAAAIAGATAMLDLSDGLAIDSRRLARASGVAIDFVALAAPPLTHAELTGGEDHSLLATFPPGVALPGGFRAIGRVIAASPEGAEVLVDGVPFEGRGGWDPYAEGSGSDAWNGAAG